MSNNQIIETSALNPQREIFRIKSTTPQESVKLRVAGYARVSSDSYDQLNSFSAQVRYYTKLIEQNESWELAEIFADEGISGYLPKSGMISTGCCETAGKVKLIA